VPVNVGRRRTDGLELHEGTQLRVIGGHELRTGLCVTAVFEVPERENASADAVASLEHRDAEAELLEPTRAREPRQAGADDDYVLPLRAEP
jgi:hypothetical protein